ncbi:MAG: sugar transferase [Pyrinomonadaceae bacterium]
MNDTNLKVAALTASANGYPWKRMFDLVAAVIGIVMMSPIFLCAAVVIKLGSRGPVLFEQERLGKNETPFQIFKFRTMVLGADRLGSGSVSLRHDPRLFWGADTLRRFKIDELPQLFNVLNGTMSIVGPRPTIREDYRRMNEVQRQRFRVKPGLTGLAQVNGNTALIWPERIEYDLAYLAQQSLWLDAKIGLRTVLLTLAGKADTHPPGDAEWPE